MADNTVYQTEKLLREQGDKISAENKRQVEEAVERLKSALKGNDIAAIKSAMEALNSRMQQVSSDLYAQAKAGRAGTTDSRAQDRGGGDRASGAGRSGKDGDVIDADFEMVDDNKK